MSKGPKDTMRIPHPFRPNGKRPPPRSTAIPPIPRVPPLRLIEQAVAGLRAPSRALSLLMVNLDRFKLVNDLCGHACGDHLIDIVYDRCTRLSGHMAVIHLGADEFACLLPVTEGTSPKMAAETIACRLLEAIGDPVSLGRHIVHPTAAIGIASDPGGTMTVEELLRGASIALSHAKQAGSGTIEQFAPEMYDSLSERAALEADLRSGLLRGEIIPHYQPIVALPSHQAVRFEALARWDHPQRGLLGPDRFLGLAENAALDDDLLFAMLRQCCRDARDWDGHLGLSLNMAPRQVCDPGIAARLMRIVFASGLRPDRLTVEITEHAVMHNVEAAQATVASLREAGIKVALDDFGTGYASLARISKLPLDMIKIDRTLVQALDSDAGRKLVKVVVDLGRSLDMPVTAEGIETMQQARHLSQLGCAFGQGFLFGRPVPSGDMASMTGRTARSLSL